MERDKIERWQKLDKKLKEVKKEEMTLRKEIVAEIHEGSKKKGTKTVDIFGVVNYKIKAINKTKLDLDKEAVNSAEGELDYAARKCLEYKPSLVKKELNKLPDDNILWNFIEEKPAAPGLEVTVEEE